MSRPTPTPAALQQIINRAIVADERLAAKTQQVLKRLEREAGR